MKHLLSTKTMKLLLPHFLAAALVAVWLTSELKGLPSPPLANTPPPPPPPDPEAPQQTAGCLCECETPGKTPHDWFMDVLLFNLGVLVAEVILAIYR